MPCWGINAKGAPFVLKQTRLSHAMKIGNLIANHLLKHSKGLLVVVFVEIGGHFISEPTLMKGERPTGCATS